MKIVCALIFASIALPASANYLDMTDGQVILNCNNAADAAVQLVQKRTTGEGYSLEWALGIYKDNGPTRPFYVQMVIAADSFKGDDLDGFAREWRDKCLREMLIP